MPCWTLPHRPCHRLDHCCHQVQVLSIVGGFCISGAVDHFVPPVNDGCLPSSAGLLPLLLTSPLSMGWVRFSYSPHIVWSVLCIDFECMIFCILQNHIEMCQVYHADLSGSLGKLNLSLNRSAWAVGLAWLTTACVSGYGGPVDWVDKPTLTMSWPS